MAITMLTAVLIVLGNLLADVAYAIADRGYGTADASIQAVSARTIRPRGGLFIALILLAALLGPLIDPTQPDVISHPCSACRNRRRLRTGSEPISSDAMNSSAPCTARAFRCSSARPQWRCRLRSAFSTARLPVSPAASSTA